MTSTTMTVFAEPPNFSFSDIFSLTLLAEGQDERNYQYRHQQHRDEEEVLDRSTLFP